MDLSAGQPDNSPFGELAPMTMGKKYAPAECPTCGAIFPVATVDGKVVGKCEFCQTRPTRTKQRRGNGVPRRTPQPSEERKHHV